MIAKANPAPLIIAVIAGAFLYLTKTFINEKFKEKLPFPIPFEFLMVKFINL